MEKIDDILIGHFPHIIIAFATFWISLIAYGLLSQ